MSRLKEQRSWDTFKRSIRESHLKCERIEATADRIPDVIALNKNGASFWIENKALDDWPKRADTHVLANAFEPGQLSFLREWAQWGGTAFVLLRVDLTYLLLNPLNPIEECGKAQLMREALETDKAHIITYLEEYEP